MKSATKLKLAATLLFASYALGLVFPGIETWGFDQWSHLPLPFAIGGLGLGLMLIWAPISTLAKDRAPTDEERKTHKASSVTIVIASTLSVAALYVFRSRALVYGDGFTVLAHVRDGAERLIFDQYYLQVGSIVLKRYLYVWLNSAFDLSAESFFSWFNIIGGIAGIVAVYHISMCLVKRPVQRVVIVIAGLTSGATLLFFGHIELYTWPLALGLWSLSYTLRGATDQNAFGLSALFGVLAVIFHAIAAPFLVVSLSVFFVSRYGGATVSFVRWIRRLALAGVVASFALVLATHLMDLPEIFIPFTVHPKNNYALLTWAHSRDVFNLLLMQAPLVVALLFFIPRNSSASSTKQSSILLLTAIYCFLPAFWIDPALGMVRDWDLLSMFGIPLSLFVISRIAMSERFDARASLLPLAVMFFAHIGPQVYEKSDLQRSVTYLDKVLWNDPHYAPEYRDGYRNQSWGRLLRREVGRPDIAEKYFVRHLKTDTAQAYSWNHLGELAFERGDFDSAAHCFDRSVRIKPDQAMALRRLAQARFEIGDSTQARDDITKSRELEPKNPLIQATAGVIFAELGSDSLAIASFKKALNLGVEPTLMLSSLAEVYSNAGVLDSSIGYYLKAFQAAPDRPDFLQKALELQIANDDLNSARETYELMLRFNPPERIRDRYEKILGL